MTLPFNPSVGAPVVFVDCNEGTPKTYRVHYVGKDGWWFAAADGAGDPEHLLRSMVLDCFLAGSMALCPAHTPSLTWHFTGLRSPFEGQRAKRPLKLSTLITLNKDATLLASGLKSSPTRKRAGERYQGPGWRNTGVRNAGSYDGSQQD